MNESSSTPPQFSRRTATKLLGGAILSTVLPSPLAEAQQTQPTATQFTRLLSDDDITFLEEMEHSACLYFTEQADPDSGQVLDRAINKTSTGDFDTHFASSTAATGFGLSALCISDRRGY